MRKIRSTLRQRALGLSAREIGRALGVSPTTVGEYLRRARDAGLSWPLAEDLDDAELERLLFSCSDDQSGARPQPDWPWVHTELRRKHVTLALLWQEYKEQHPDGYQYTQFCEHYRRWAGRISV